MTYEELVRRVRDYTFKTDASMIKEHVAVQFNVYGEGEGAFYMEVKNGLAEAQPYEYYDRDAVVYVDAYTMLDIISGNVSFLTAYNEHRIVVQGKHDAVLQLDRLYLPSSNKKGTGSKQLQIRRMIRKRKQRRRPQRVIHQKN